MRARDCESNSIIICVCRSFNEGTCEGTSSVTLTVQNTSKQSSMVQTAAGSAWEVLGPGSSAVVAVGGIVALLGTTGTNARLKYKIVDGAAAVAVTAASSSGGGGGRAAAAAGSGACSPAAKRAKKQWGGGGGWAAGLSIYLDNTSDPAVVHVDDEVIAVKDKFPKAKYHYLVMPRDRSLHHYKDLYGISILLFLLYIYMYVYIYIYYL